MSLRRCEGAKGEGDEDGELDPATQSRKATRLQKTRGWRDVEREGFSLGCLRFVSLRVGPRIMTSRRSHTWVLALHNGCAAGCMPWVVEGSRLDNQGSHTDHQGMGGWQVVTHPYAHQVGGLAVATLWTAGSPYTLPF